MKFLVPVLTVLFHLLELIAALVVFPLTAVCMLGLMLFTLHIAWKVRTSRPPIRLIHRAALGSTA